MCGHRKTHTKTEPQWLVLINKVIKLNKPQKNISQSESRFNESRKTHGMPYELNIKNQLSDTNTKEYFKMCFLTFQQIYLVDSLVAEAAPKSCHHKHMYGHCAYAVWSAVRGGQTRNVYYKPLNKVSKAYKLRCR